MCDAASFRAAEAHPVMKKLLVLLTLTLAVLVPALVSSSGSKSAARAAVTLPDAKGRAVAAMPKERNDALKHDRTGILGMTSPTEFYITTARASSFDKRYPAIGTVVADMKVVSELKKDDAISRVTIIRIGAEAVGFGK